MKEEICILKTWKGETFEIEMKYEDYLEMESKLKSQGEDGFNSKKYRRFIKFASIEDKIGKTKYLALERPKEEFKELNPEERKKVAESIKKGLEITFEGRKKRFIERRQELLKQLEKEEKAFGLETTLEKISELESLRLIKIKNKINE